MNPKESSYRGKVQKLRRVGIPKPIYDLLELDPGDTVDVTIRLVKDSDKK